MDICLPGIGPVNRAATGNTPSSLRDNDEIDQHQYDEDYKPNNIIANDEIPKSPIMLPAYPSRRIKRVEVTLRDSLKRVAIRVGRKACEINRIFEVKDNK